MNCIRETLDINHDDEIVDAKKNIAKVVAEIKMFQEKIREYIESNYVEFISDLRCNSVLLNEVDTLIDVTEDLKENIKTGALQELAVASQDLSHYMDDLNEVFLGLKISKKILKIDDLFISLETAKSANEQLKIMDIISELKTLIFDSNDCIFKKLACYQHMKISYQVESQLMLHNLKIKFENLVQLNEKCFQNTKSVTIKITKDDNQLHETVIALMNAKYNPKKICDFLLENVFEPIITKPVSLEYDDSSDDYVVLTLSYNTKSSTNTNLRPNYKITFKNIESVITCLGYMNVSISEDICVFTIFSDYMKEIFFSMLINECLLHSIPDTMDEMDESTLVHDINVFNKYLIEMLFIKECDEYLLNYTKKIDTLFLNRFCKNIVDNSIKIMHKDLHDMILISEGNNIASASGFLRCMVSKSVIELVHLLEKILKQSENSPKETSDRLLSTISIILDRYITEVPTYHSKLLTKIPQQTAIFHNNCVYLVNWIQINFKQQDFQVISRSIEKQGTHNFDDQIQNQKDQLIDILKEFDLNNLTAELGPAPYKIIRQCLRQLDLLKNVWQTILPDIIYNRTMGLLLNDFLNEFMRRVLTVEDIPTPVANDLVEICSTILERAQTLFEDQLQVSINVKSWMKLQQLKMILGASLFEITEQWSERKGPLTLNYKADEVKHLIRALFQNTDRRAKALSKIS